MKNTGINLALSPNEKLFLAGQLKKFEKAVLKARRRDAIDLLVGVGLSGREAEQTVEEILAAPRRYGYCPGGCLPKGRINQGQ